MFACIPTGYCQSPGMPNLMETRKLATGGSISCKRANIFGDMRVRLVMLVGLPRHAALARRDGNKLTNSEGYIRREGTYCWRYVGYISCMHACRWNVIGARACPTLWEQINLPVRMTLAIRGHIL